MAKKLATFSLDEEVIEALDKTLKTVPMSKSAFVNMLIGGACGLYDTSSVLGTMFSAAKDARDARKTTNTDGKVTA